MYSVATLNESQPAATAQPRQGKATEMAYEHLRNGVLRGDFPVGTVLAETDVATSLGISRTPVRQALRALLQEGLVGVGPRRQIVVSGISPERRREIFLIREALERVAVAEACTAMGLDEIDQLRLLVMRARRAADAGNVEEFIDIDEQFHLAIAAGAKLSLVVKFLEQLRAFVRMMGLNAVISGGPDRMHRVLEEHTEIIDGLEKRNPRAAVRAMTHHLTATREVFATEGNGAT